jgi:hypothetical protein
MQNVFPIKFPRGEVRVREEELKIGRRFVAILSGNVDE